MDAHTFKLLKEIVALLKQINEQHLETARNQVAIMSALKRIEEKANGPGGN